MVKMNADSAFAALANDIASRYRRHVQVEAVALGGSLVSGVADSGSDIDLYVYLIRELAIQSRAEIAKESAVYFEIDNRFWEPGDEWIDANTRIHVDVMFRTQAWIENQLDRSLKRHEASVGYSTCLWHNVISSRALFDRHGWFRSLQDDSTGPFPEPLRCAIVAKNHPILRQTASSYMYQLDQAVTRRDWVSVNHRVAAILASYFDILFAINRIPHPGEKHLVDRAEKLCAKTPHEMGRQVNATLRAAAKADHGIVEQAKKLVAGLDDLLSDEGFDLSAYGGRVPPGKAALNNRAKGVAKAAGDKGSGDK